MENIENKRRKNYDHLEVVQEGFANGIVKGGPLKEEQKTEMLEEATEAFGKFLDALKCDWRHDPNSMETPRRVAKKYLEQWGGRYNDAPSITSFPSDGYQGMVVECNIPLISMCSHHHETIMGKVHIAYIPGDGENARVIGLSKLNRLVEHFGRRGQIQEQLTMSIHQAIDKVCEGNIGVAVQIVGTHQCVSCRGVGHQGTSMVTTHLTGAFKEKLEVREEFFYSIKNANDLK